MAGVEANSEALNTTVVPQLATKADLKELASELKQEMWKQCLRILLGVLAIGGFLISFMIDFDARCQVAWLETAKLPGFSLDHP